MMTRDVVRSALAVLALAACTRAAPPGVATPSAEAVAPEPLLPPAVDLTGSWYVGDGPEPAVAKIMLYPTCAQNPAQWLIRQVGNEVEAWTFAESFNQGIARAGPGPERVVPARGTMSGVNLALDDAGVRVVMRYDSVTRHLSGTRGGQPLWAVRQVIVRVEACPGIP